MARLPRWKNIRICEAFSAITVARVETKIPLMRKSRSFPYLWTLWIAMISVRCILTKSCDLYSSFTFRRNLCHCPLKNSTRYFKVVGFLSQDAEKTSCCHHQRRENQTDSGCLTLEKARRDWEVVTVSSTTASGWHCMYF